MHILFITNYYPPEVGAAAARISFFANFIKSKGFQTSILCPNPSYPSDSIFSGYKNSLFSTEDVNGVMVMRSYIYMNKKKKTWGRILHYFSFVFSGIINSGKVKKPDIIFVSSPPLTVGILGWWYKRKFKCPMYFDVRDIWPDSIQAVSQSNSSSFFYKFLLILEKKIYRLSSKIFHNSKSNGEILEKLKQVSKDKLVFLPNGAEIDFFSHGNVQLVDSRINRPFIVLYTGNIGLAQKLDTLITCARVLKDNNDIQFVIIGDGVERDKILSYINKAELDNVLYLGKVDRSDIPHYLAISSVCIIPYKNNALFSNVLPSKLFDYWAAKKPVVINLTGEAADLIKDAKGGIIVRPEDPQDMANAIVKLYCDRRLARTMGEHGFAYVKLHFDRVAIGGKLVEILEQ